MNVHDFLDADFVVNQIHIEANNDLQDGVFFIYSTIDELLTHGSFELCDQILRSNFDNLPVVHLLALLSITLPARHELKQRETFSKRVRTHIMKKDSSRAEELLAGLE